MKKILVLFIAIIFLTAGCMQQADEKQKKEPKQISGSIEDLLAQDTDLRCELVAKQKGNIVSGTTYIADNQARSNFQVKTAEGQIMTSHMINDGTWLYTWSDEFPGQAVKIKLETMETDQFDSEEAKNQAQEHGMGNYETEFDYKCYEWDKDPSLFTPPVNVDFIDFSQIMAETQKMLEGFQADQQMPDKEDLCAQCEAISDAQAREMCKQRLGCQ